MSDINYLGAVVRILEAPRRIIFEKDILVVKCRAQLPQFRGTRVINLTFFGNLANEVLKYYKVNDYILIEGYLSIITQENANLSFPIMRKANVSVFKIYPFLLNLN
jgi:hypothetical protein